MMKSVAAETACTTDHHGKQDISADSIAIISWQTHTDVIQSTMTEKNVQILKVRGK